MASKVKQKIRKSLDESEPPSNGELADQYLLSVTAGPSYDESTHERVFVNDPNKTCVFSNEFVTTQVKVRIRDYRGLPRDSPSTSQYFEDPMHVKDSYGVAFSFVPKHDLPSRDTVWGNDLDHPVRDRLPPGVNTAFKIVKSFIDPGLSMDVYADKPWLYGPALSCWFKFRVGEKVDDPESTNFPIANDDAPLQEGADGDGETIRSELGLPDDSEKRRKFFLNETNRDQFVFEKGRCYQGDFFNPYLDFSKFALKLPGISIGVLKYISDKTHTLRYVFKNPKTGDLYFCIVVKLLFGDELRQALTKEDGLSTDEDGSDPTSPVEAAPHDHEDRNSSSKESSTQPSHQPQPNDDSANLLMPKLNQAEHTRDQEAASPKQNATHTPTVDTIRDLLQATKTRDADSKPLNIFRP